jgi:hypothetical protein
MQEFNAAEHRIEMASPLRAVRALGEAKQDAA